MSDNCILGILKKLTSKGKGKLMLKQRIQAHFVNASLTMLAIKINVERCFQKAFFCSYNDDLFYIRNLN